MYIVQLTDKPLAAYDGGVAGFAATKAEDGQKLNPQSKQSLAYLKHLSKQRDVAANKVGIRPEVTYSTAFNGFAAELTSTQAAKLAKFSGVAKIYKHELLTLDTYTTHEFLGLAGSDGVWQQRFGGQGKAGEGVIVGMIDSGYSPENPSFAALPNPRPDAKIIQQKWKSGKISGNVDNRDNSPVCDYGTDSADKPGAKPFTCNNKVIGARWYRTGIAATPEEFNSPRDHGGHGTHTGSTAAGNANVDAYSVAPDGKTRLSYGKISGMAPAARLAIYKVCWSIDNVGGNSCSNIDSVKAIDQSVLDGVDVINYSISGSRTHVVDPVEIAFLNAAQAGVFVAASAGNSGDTTGVSSVAHNSPWVTTVAASTHDRAFTKNLTLGNGKTYNGAGVGAALSSAQIVDSVDVGKADADKTKVELCYVDTLDPDKVKDKIVLCKRGVNARTDKSKAVQQAGGVGMVLYNPGAESLAADVHSVPSVHVNNIAGAEVKAYIAAAKANAKAS
ncbi:MAG: S8 family serine peptidase, partial [Longispora sp.]|nr:S8 family serine peptidase [Longispora sp. (in: high G+C Gram-positive bacteria)]